MPTLAAIVANEPKVCFDMMDDDEEVEAPVSKGSPAGRCAY
jgi:hypothetical protein